MIQVRLHLQDEATLSSNLPHPKLTNKVSHINKITFLSSQTKCQHILCWCCTPRCPLKTSREQTPCFVQNSLTSSCDSTQTAMHDCSSYQLMHSKDPQYCFRTFATICYVLSLVNCTLAIEASPLNEGNCIKANRINVNITIYKQTGNGLKIRWYFKEKVKCKSMISNGSMHVVLCQPRVQIKNISNPKEDKIFMLEATPNTQTWTMETKCMQRRCSIQNTLW